MGRDMITPITRVAAKVVPRFRDFNPLGFLSDFAQLYAEIQRQKTERARIEAETRVRLAEIEARKRIFLDYLDMAFMERKENFKRLFGAVDVAMAKANNEQLAMALDSLNKLAKTTPFKDLIDVDRTRELLEKPGHEWTF
jgi:formate dehydrogenase maturation protein FdhE